MRFQTVLFYAFWVTLCNCYSHLALAAGGPKGTAHPNIQAACAALLTGKGEAQVSSASPKAITAPQTDEQFLEHVIKAYPEMVRLTGQVNATPEGLKNAIGVESISKRMFGEQHIEFDRTSVGLLTMKWVLENNYDAFTKPQGAAVKMSRASFDHLRQYTLSILKTPADVDAMIAYMVINDLGKVKSVVAEIEKETGFTDIDHDKILLYALERKPAVSPSFSRLSHSIQQKMLKGLRAQFNIGQFIQAENVPASLLGLKGLDNESLDFYLLHAVFDIAGAAGHVNPSGSVVMTEPTYVGFRSAISAINQFNQGADAAVVYDAYLSSRGRDLGLSVNNPTERAVLRLALNLRAPNATEAKSIYQIFNSLHTNTRAILTNELNQSGLNGSQAILLYYSPAMLVNAKAAFAATNTAANASEEGLKFGLTTLARLFQLGRIEIRKRTGSGVYTLIVAKVAEAIKTPQDFLNKDIQIQPVGQDGETKLVDKAPVDASVFPAIQNASQIPGKRVVTIGIGGGSDGVQAAQVARALSTNKQIAAVISVRTSKPTSQSGQGDMAASRTIENHGGEVVSGVFRVLPKSTGSGRFLENIPAEIFPTYLVIDEQNGTLEARLRAALSDAGQPDTIVAVDTGGDALFSETVEQGARATPDQDLRVLNTLANLRDFSVLTAEVAVGVDSPYNAQTVLQNAGARYWDLDAGTKAQILQSYRNWRMDGSDQNRYGKTPLAWQLALSAQTGLQTLNLPTQIVLDHRNPWNPFVVIQDSMKGIFVMSLQGHLRAIKPN